MLTKITLENFKVFRHATEFPLAKINLLTGINGRGKSSLLQSLLLMRQSMEYTEFSNKLILNGSCLHLGTWDDVKNKDEKEKKCISLSFSSTWNNINITTTHDFIKTLEAQRFEIMISQEVACYVETDNNNDMIVVDRIEVFQDNDKYYAKYYNYNNLIIEISPTVWMNIHYRLFPNFTVLSGDTWRARIIAFGIPLMRTHYIAADRIGARDFYEKDLNLNYNFITIEKTGKNVLDIISYYKAREVNTSLYLGDENNLIAQIGKWLGHILDATVSIDLDDSNKFVNSFTYTINGKENLLPTNVGFGYSYILPIITAGLIANPNEILIVENPEAHLHPKAQSRLTQFLAKVAATGVQVFVESHSDHILRGLQIATISNETQTKILDKEDVSILYFHNPTETNNSYFTQIPILENGAIENWEEGFFDQADKDYKILFGF